MHASQLICTDCHAKYDQDHPSGATFPSRRAYTVGAYELCKKCHFDTYTRTLESVHYELLKAGRGQRADVRRTATARTTSRTRTPSAP